MNTLSPTSWLTLLFAIIFTALPFVAVKPIKQAYGVSEEHTLALWFLGVGVFMIAAMTIKGTLGGALTYLVPQGTDCPGVPWVMWGVLVGGFFLGGMANLAYLYTAAEHSSPGTIVAVFNLNAAFVLLGTWVVTVYAPQIVAAGVVLTWDKNLAIAVSIATLAYALWGTK